MSLAQPVFGSGGPQPAQRVLRCSVPTWSVRPSLPAQRSLALRSSSAAIVENESALASAVLLAPRQNLALRDLAFQSLHFLVLGWCWQAQASASALGELRTPSWQQQPTPSQQLHRKPSPPRLAWAQPRQPSPLHQRLIDCITKRSLDGKTTTNIHARI